MRPSRGGRTPRPPHVISPDEVAAWLAGSANQAVTYHRTTREAAADIVARGVDISRSRIGAYGQGFYTATDPDAFVGDALVNVAIRARRPLLGDLDEVGSLADAIARDAAGRPVGLSPRLAAVVRREFLLQGYDAIIVRDAGGDGIDYVVALDEATVRVIQP